MKNLHLSISLLALFIFPLFSFAQETLEKHRLAGFTRVQYNQVINKYFGKIVGTKANDELPGNYATFDPSNGALKFNGTVPIGKKTSEVFSYLTFNISGDLMDNSYVALFSGDKLNRNVSIKSAYHFRLGKTTAILNEDKAIYYKFKDTIAALKAKAQRASFISDTTVTHLLISQNSHTLSYLKGKKIAVANKLTTLKTDLLKIDSNSNKKLERLKAWDQLFVSPSFKLLTKDTKQNYQKEYADTLAALDQVLATQKTTLESVETISKELEQLIKKEQKLTLEQDSLRLRNNNAKQIARALRGENLAAEEKQRTKLFKEFKLAGFSIDWLTLTAEGGNKRFYTYNKSLAFAEQLGKNDLLTYKFGIMYNYYKLADVTKNVIYFNVGLHYGRDNNTRFLSTTKINQEVAYKNTAGDTTRKIVNTYDAYTDAVTNTKQWSLAPNIYYLFANGEHGIHIFPSFNKLTSKAIHTNIGFGYIFSFQNEKKEEPIINAELYYQYTDLFDNLNTKSTLKSRGELGFRIGVPFKLFLD